MDAKYAIPRVAGHFCAIVPKESSMGYDKSGHHQLRETWKQRPKLHGEDMIRYDPICRCRNYLRTGDGAWNAAFCEYSVNVLCTFVESITSGEETPWRSYHLNLFTVQERLQKQTRAQPCLMPAWYGLMSSSSWLQLFITFPLAAACEIWIASQISNCQAIGEAPRQTAWQRASSPMPKTHWKGVFWVVPIYNNRGAYDDDHEANWSSIFQSFCQIVHRMEGTWRSKCVSI